MPQSLYEQYRLSRLQRLGILDTPPEERFDYITRLAKELYGTDISLVSLLDANRQWFKSKQGLEVSETDRTMAFCDHAIKTNDIFVVNDASTDPRFIDNPLVTGEPGIRFYAGMPIREPTGFKLGTLCIIDSKPRDLEASELTTLRELASLVECEIEQIYDAEAKVRLLDSESLNACLNQLRETVHMRRTEVDFQGLLNDLLGLTSCQFGLINAFMPADPHHMKVLACQATGEFSVQPKLPEALEAHSYDADSSRDQVSEELAELMANAERFFTDAQHHGSMSLSLPIKDAESILGFVVLHDRESRLNNKVAEELSLVSRLLAIALRRMFHTRPGD